MGTHETGESPDEFFRIEFAWRDGLAVDALVFHVTIPFSNSSLITCRL